MDRVTGSRAGHGPVLVLGGTTEGRELAGLLVDSAMSVISSLAGRVSDPLLPPGDVRIGGFGGVAGLVDFLTRHRVGAVLDATHPFAEHMTAHAAEACRLTGTPMLRLARPSWAGRPGSSSWHWVDSLSEARSVAERLGVRMFLAIGRQDLHHFASWDDRYVLTRVITIPDGDLPRSWEVVSARGPFRRDDEAELMGSKGIQVLVTKDSGGPTTAKLDAAAELGIAVVVVRRPAQPSGVPTVATAAEAFAWVTAPRRQATGPG